MYGVSLRIQNLITTLFSKINPERSAAGGSHTIAHHEPVDGNIFEQNIRITTIEKSQRGDHEFVRNDGCLRRKK